MSQRSFNAQQELNAGINSMMDSAGAQGLCIPIAAAYRALLSTVNTIAGPVTSFQADIIKNLDSATTDTFNEINKALDVLNDVCNSVNSLQISGTSLQALNIIKRVCLDFNDILPNSMKNLIDSASSTVNDLASTMFELPGEIIDLVEDNIVGLKDKALNDALLPAANTVLGAIDNYRNFIKSTGIITMIDKLAKFEKCMMNPQHCNRPRSEFIYPGTTKYNSQYYRDFFAMNTKGELQLKQFLGDSKSLSAKINKSLKKLDAFRASPVNMKK